MSTSFPTLAPLGAAIAQAEGYGQPGAIPTLANNPGSLELGNQGYGVIQAAGGNQITVFPTPQAGANALQRQIDSIFNGTSQNYNPSMSLQQFGSIYSGGNPNYGNTLAQNLGVDPNASLSDIGSAWGAVPPSLGGGGFLNPLNNQGFFAHPLNATVTAVGDLLFSSRLIVLVVGLLLLAAGLFSFKGTQQLFSSAAGAAKKAGEIAA